MPNKPSVTPAFALIKKSWGEFKPLWKKFVLLQLIPLIPMLGMVVLAVIVMVAVGVSPTRLGDQIAVWTVVVLGVVATLLVGFLTSVAQLSLARDRDPKPGVWDRFWGAKEKLWGYAWVGVLATLAIAIGWILFLVPGVILGVMLVFAWVINIFEGQRGFNALRASRELVRGFWWTVFARYLVFLVLVWLITILGYIPFVGLIWSVVIGFIIGPIGMFFMVHLWEELRTLKKGNAGAVDGMSGGKKFGLVVAMILPVLLVPLLLVLAVVGDLKKNLPALPDNTEIEGSLEFKFPAKPTR